MKKKSTWHLSRSLRFVRCCSALLVHSIAEQFYKPLFFCLFPSCCNFTHTVRDIFAGECLLIWMHWTSEPASKRQWNEKNATRSAAIDGWRDERRSRTMLWATWMKLAEQNAWAFSTAWLVLLQYQVCCNNSLINNNNHAFCIHHHLDMHFGTFVPLAMSRLVRQPTIHRSVSFQFIRLIEFWARAHFQFGLCPRSILVTIGSFQFTMIHRDSKWSMREPALARLLVPYTRVSIAKSKNDVMLMFECWWCGKLCMNFSFGFFSSSQFVCSAQQMAATIDGIRLFRIYPARDHVIEHKHFVELIWNGWKNARQQLVFCYLMICDCGADVRARCARSHF